MTRLDDYRLLIERAARFHEEPGECLVFEDMGKHLVWCHPDDRQAFLDAGIPEDCLLHPLRPEDER